ncbi:hypothetical protein ABZ848_36605 [Streptomyces sp. NPDC047081]|uniref:hypothetical protein n=1 Tax=Streptomyces sp. NPDC047081 TaxID=3154706 RepID=UPI0033EF832C
MLAAGGVALAAGVLSLVRMAPESGNGGYGTAEAEPRQDPVTGAERSTNTAATVRTVPHVSPSATSPMGGISGTPTAGSTLVPLPTTSTPPTPLNQPDATTIPEAPNTPAPTTTPHPPTTTNPAPHSPPPVDRTTPPPTPQPTQTSNPGLCVPLVGLCVGPLAR